MKGTLLLSTVIGLFVACAKPVTLPINMTGTYLTEPPVDSPHIAWDYTTLRKIAPLPGQAAGYCGYARLIQRADHTLLCVYEASGSVELVRSTDGGNTWSGRVVVAAREPGVSMAVPEIVELADQSLLVSYNPRPGRTATGKRFGIRTIKSYDGGASWTDRRLVYEAGVSFDNGCWEPVAMQLPSGEVQLYFSDEGVYTTSNEQNISLMRSADGGLTWTARPEIVSFRAGKRDGMPVPIVLNGTDVAFSIEDNVQTAFKPYIIRNSIADNWQSGPVGGDNPNRTYALSQPLSETVYAGAPYLRQLQSGATILGVQSTENRINNRLAVSRLVVYVGDRDARNFKQPTEPFLIQPTHSGLWNSLSVLRGDTVVALTSTKSYGGANPEVWMIKGYVIPEQVASFSSVTVDGELGRAEWPATLPIFIGHRGPAQLRAGFAYTDTYLFVGVQVADRLLKTDSPTPLDDDGIWLGLDVINTLTTASGSQKIQLLISADGRLLVRKGAVTDWVPYAGLGREIRLVLRKTSAGYVAELAVPWTLVGGKPTSRSAIRYTLGLLNDDDGAAIDYTDNLGERVNNEEIIWQALRLADK
ncbi:sugar-binding protein [Fibrella forsythiae]|uniref:Carbohydrate-binding domain-containing protein n=1 Tax=Fibrella forsythiae TaxID=2817061 RepID=A0ABS3JR83_9BACT|nr:sugar-binding protein [Fibrella forsythiae]MBO0952510.1 hypothetical protein [Fibrella forsythiae]